MGVETTLKKVAEYISVTQPIVDEYNELKENIVKQAHQTVGALETVGLVSSTKKAELVQQLIDNPLESFGMLRKLAANIKKVDDDPVNNSIGKSAAITEGTINDQKLDAFGRWILYGDPRAEGVDMSHILF